MSFDLRHGEVLGVIGRNGAGKSTLLKLLSRITEPTTGTRRAPRPRRLAARGGHRLPSRADRAREHLHERRDPGHATTRDPRRFDEIVEFSGVEQFLDTPVKRYSSGMQVRLGFAVAAHLEPDILIVDEVLAVGDAEFQRSASARWERSDSGRTVLFVSHNMASIGALAGSAILLDGGRTVANGTSEDVIRNYLRATEALHFTELKDRWTVRGMAG